MQKNKNSTIDTEEISHFAKDSMHWWSETGPFAPLHRLNPVRLEFIKDQICKHYDLAADTLTPLKSLTTIDIGCGGGLVCEPLARLGAKVTGLDADANAIEAAQNHAKDQSLKVDYRCADAATLKEKFDVVLALEIIEHVSDPATFIELCKTLCKPGGLIIVSTLNRTKKSYALGIVAAERLLGWVPPGTHTWQKFIKPSELAREARKNGMSLIEETGLTFNPLQNGFQLSPNDLDVNYLMSFKNEA
ncbi:MAG: bifunctional 2-polyprenyl-6-hydroxyphenol methylase/3-demethylubiquinol 3-O-methyltransferase UbiG [Alphaproteobacteria bacterium]|nr:bifunctional 2-polyprenyl-6-hydroxyphenol methylase/3-demethylubiquinol 3-O-methyltransferase UbiG [Alphaproteobacteria bacterium]